MPKRWNFQWDIDYELLAKALSRKENKKTKRVDIDFKHCNITRIVLWVLGLQLASLHLGGIIFTQKKCAKKGGFVEMYYFAIMKKGFYFLLTIFLLGCDKENINNCFQTAGEMTSKEIPVEPFHELIVYEGINLFIEQGTEYKVSVESGENLIGEITAEVENERLSLRNKNDCNLFRDYNLTSVYVSVPDLDWLQNAGNNTIESIGTLQFPKLWLRSFNQEKNPDIYTNGDFNLKLISEEIRITSDNYSNFFLSGETGYLDAYIAAGNGRLEAAGLIAETVEIQHRGTNTLIVNPQQVLKGEIRSTGDVISVNRPPKVSIETFYTGVLIYKAP